MRINEPTATFVTWRLPPKACRRACLASLGEDEKFLLELEKGCSTKTQEWEEIKKTIAEELVALADAFQVLNERSPKHTKKEAGKKEGCTKENKL